MTAAVMTQKQRAAVEAWEAARAQRCSLTQYARTYGLKVQQIYATLSEMRKQGLLAKSERKLPSRFVTVKVQPRSVSIPEAVAGSTGVLCRITHGSGCVIECLQWPSPSWLTALSEGLTDAAA
jgi:predicted transcriptional regulator